VDGRITDLQVYRYSMASDDHTQRSEDIDGYPQFVNDLELAPAPIVVRVADGMSRADVEGMGYDSRPIPKRKAPDCTSAGMVCDLSAEYGFLPSNHVGFFYGPSGQEASGVVRFRHPRGNLMLTYSAIRHVPQLTP
jgi:hypothetical protein